MSDEPTRIRIAPSTPPPASGEAERYVHLGRLGAGGLGEVLLVQDRLLGRAVALKRARAGTTGGGAFLDEARLGAILEHPNLVPVHDLGWDRGGEPWFTMRRVEGRSLTARLSGRTGPPDGAFLREMLEILLKVCDGVSFANDHGLVHCDLKPENVMAGDHGEVFVIDWGVAVREGATGDEISGTPGYMAPEQAARRAVDRRADVHGLGAILYRILTGVPPYTGRNSKERIARTLRGPLVRPREQRPDWPLPERLCRIAERALARDPADRHPSVGALQSELRAVLHGVEAVSRRSCAVGEYLARTGERGTDAFVVLEGAVEVRAGDRVLRRVGPGEIVGELGLVTGEPRTADLVVVAPTVVGLVTPDLLEGALVADSWLALLVRSLAARFREAHLRGG